MPQMMQRSSLAIHAPTVARVPLEQYGLPMQIPQSSVGGLGFPNAGLGWNLGGGFGADENGPFFPWANYPLDLQGDVALTKAGQFPFTMSEWRALTGGTLPFST